MALARKDMIETLQAQYDNWHEVYLLFDSKVANVTCIHGWYMAHDGPSVDEMYLVNVHPMSDESGVCINSGIFKKLEQVKPVVLCYKNTHWHGRVGYGGWLSQEFDKEGMIHVAKVDFEKTGIKSKFRPVYAKG